MRRKLYAHNAHTNIIYFFKFNYGTQFKYLRNIPNILITHFFPRLKTHVKNMSHFYIIFSKTRLLIPKYNKKT